MPPLVVQEPEVDFLLDALDGALSDLEAGVGPEETAPARPRRRPTRAQAG
jgi:hypothetical protein